MTNKKLTRRDAIKLLGAATGASLLANLPSKWSKPELAGGVLPAHAQTSEGQPSAGLTFLEGLFDLIDRDLGSIPQRQGAYKLSAPSRVQVYSFIGSHFVIISQPIAGVPLKLVTSSNSAPVWNETSQGVNTPPDGIYNTQVGDYSNPPVTVGAVKIFLDVEYAADIIFTWSFVNPSDGTDTGVFTLSVDDGLVAT